MVSKSQIKLITSLAQKKYRYKHGLFVAEGFKTINELINSKFSLNRLFTISADFKVDSDKIQKLDDKELKKISFLKTPQAALALFEIPEENISKEKEFTLALDGIRDPGNLGTIIRLCDWFGITNLVCSQDSVDCYNPKVVQATMGSLARVNISYCDLEPFLKNSELPVYGAFMEGENIYKSETEENAILVMGNEANGISAEIEELIPKKISVPRFGELKETESLNVATATAILLSEFKRKDFTR
ncbi:TrmH family RNA methyltransferase [Salegentibacter salegens]|uniref:RNA methyltransferase, TrmH family n=1 Tax=Salegentibacter salegens TaxID=143223 RepID=A0A1M7L1C5_9FLAO|nr:RNA methyltransferase [Salegentibacter salegens]PRX44848.1 TrmH family RNA methyltransferase [Salegentibacter salegens]SHM71732.1 RNA methyltransferase, TrmH family [Salegentibacter salegens]